MIAKMSKMIARSARVSDVIGSAKGSSQIAWIGRRNIEGSQEGQNMLEIGRKCRRELRDDVGRQRNVKLSMNQKCDRKCRKKKVRKLENQTPAVGSKMIHPAVLCGQKTTTITL